MPSDARRAAEQAEAGARHAAAEALLAELAAEETEAILLSIARRKRPWAPAPGHPYYPEHGLINLSPGPRTRDS